MSKLKIYTYPESVLAKKAQPIERISKQLYPLADNMLETMYYAPGIGLAANQVGILKRILVVDIDYHYSSDHSEEYLEDLEEKQIINKKPFIIINPKIIYKEGEQCFKEGCLSVPEFQHEIIRAEKIKVSYQTIDGVKKVLSADGLLSVVLQHEMDHLDGKLFIDRLNLFTREKIKKALKKQEPSSNE